MKKLWLIALLLTLIVCKTEEAPMKELENHLIVEYNKKVDFLTSYNKLRKVEGNYVNHPRDKGKETYAGITSAYNPNWYGWRYIKGKKLKWNEYVPEAESWVLDFYLTVWVREGFYKLTNQEVADYLFDMRIHISRRQTINIINNITDLNLIQQEYWLIEELDELDLLLLKMQREKYYFAIVNKSPSQKVFIKSWIRRANYI